MNNKEIVDMLRSLFLIKGYTLVQSSDQSADIVIQNDSHSQSISLFNLARQIEQLESPQQALYIPEMIWDEQVYLTPDTVLLVLSNMKYNPDDYIHDFEKFKKLKINKQ